jgi:hypothetical protein
VVPVPVAATSLISPRKRPPVVRESSTDKSAEQTMLERPVDLSVMVRVTVTVPVKVVNAGSTAASSAA